MEVLQKFQKYNYLFFSLNIQQFINVIIPCCFDIFHNLFYIIFQGEAEKHRA